MKPKTRSYPLQKLPVGVKIYGVMYMQTFLPYPSFCASAASLDNRRLGKQRVEAWQILLVLLGKQNGWRNHPAVRMWKGYGGALAVYGLAICLEWRRRGYQDVMLHRFDEYSLKIEPHPPPWLGDPAFHASHRSNLLRKDPIWYGQFGWVEPDNLPYVWPVKSGD